MYSELNFQNPVTDVHYHPRDHMVAFCSLGENHPVLIYDYDVASKYLSLRLSCRSLFCILKEVTCHTVQLTLSYKNIYTNTHT